jgi:hypothetical protein
MQVPLPAQFGERNSGMDRWRTRMSLESALSGTAALLQPGQSHYPSLFERDGVTPTIFLPNELIEPIQKEIEGIPELARLGKATLTTPYSSAKLSPYHLARASVYRLFERTSPAEIVVDLLDLSRCTDSTTITYVGLYGGGITGEVPLTGGVIAMPAELSPRSLARELIFGIDRWNKPKLDHSDLPRWKPNIALLISEQMKILSDESTSAESLEGREPLLLSIEQKIERAIKALTLAGGYPFVRNWHISWIAHPAIPYEGFGGNGATGQIRGIPHHLGTADPVDTPLAKELYSRLESLPPKIEEPIGLAIERLRRSRTHRPSADTALDLGIATELVLLHGIPGTELTFRSALRGAYLLGKDGPDRKAKFDTFRALYKARSQAVHDGHVDEKLLSRLPEFDAVCAAAILKLVNLQKFPDWDQLTLGS